MGSTLALGVIVAIAIVVVAVAAIWRAGRLDIPKPPPGAPPPLPTVLPDGRSLQVTDGTKHLVPLAEILAGGPPKDGIPPIDRPQFTTLPERDPLLRADGIGLALVVGADARFYPYQILVWHEIVNDTVGGSPVSVTYCPLCFTGIVFDRRVAGGGNDIRHLRQTLTK